MVCLFIQSFVQHFCCCFVLFFPQMNMKGAGNGQLSGCRDDPVWDGNGEVGGGVEMRIEVAL